MSKVLGIIAEYNPLHNGHIYHLQSAKSQTESDYVVAILTGNFTQRGNTSLLNKWEKTKVALKNGVDLVIELPTIYSISSAENFASGAIKILDIIGIVDYLAFGMENPDLTNMLKIAKTLTTEPSKYKKLLNFELDKGLSYSKSVQNAIMHFYGDAAYADYFKGSNNVLAIEYLKALSRNKCKITPIGIKREKVYYNSNKIIDEFASSSGIRRLLMRSDYADIRKVTPKYSYEVLMENIKNGTYVKDIQSFSNIIFYKLRNMSLEQLRNVPEVSEGLENALKNEARETNNLITFVNNVKSKRYSQNRIQRILLYILLDITIKDMEMSKKVIPYIRVLGFNESGRKLLSEINWRANTITSVKRFEESNINKKYKTMLDIDKRATDIYTLGYQNNSVCGLDYTKRVIIV